MIGGGAENLNEFKGEELFSPIRITISPILIVFGYVIILYSIMKKPASNHSLISDTKSHDEVSSNQKKSK